MDIQKSIEAYKEGKVSVVENTKQVLEKIKNDTTNAYIAFDEEDSIKRAEYLDKKLANNEKLGKLFGIAVAVKDLSLIHI